MNAKWMQTLSMSAVVALVASAAQATPIVRAQVLGYDLVKVGNPGNAAQSGATGTGSGAAPGGKSGPLSSTGLPPPS